MPARFLSILILLLFLSSFQSANCQAVEKALRSFKDNYTSEGIYIHYDKENYVAGETIWFKAYLFAGTAPSMYSSGINIELLNDSGKVVARKILPVIGGSAAGEFELPNDAPQMYYTVRAYTRRMMNFGNDHFYEHQLQVFNPSVISGKSVPAETRIYFLPEGGNIVAGVTAVIAFKATDKYGYPLNCDGDIINSKGDTITTFRSVHDGMGKFYFLPEADEKYSAVCKINNSIEKIALPPVKVSGFTFHVQTDGGKKYFIVNKEKVATPSQQPAYLIGVIDKTVIFRQEISAASVLVKGGIPVSQLPSGILQLTLFNKDDQPLAERMLFIRNNDFLLPGNFNIGQSSVLPRAKNNYTFTLQDTIAGTFSVSVTDYNRELPAGSRENIISRLMLSNEIKGYLHNPIYYFEKNDDERNTNLDLVMMTNGWRNFNWDQVLNKHLPALSYKDGNYISVFGKAYDSKNVLLSETDMNVFINTADSANEFLSVHIDKNGEFSIPGMIFQDTARMSFQLNAGKDRTLGLSLYNQPVSKMFSFVPRSIAGSIKPLNDEAAINSLAAIKDIYSNVIDTKNQKFVSLNDVRLSTVKAKSKTRLIQERYLSGLFNSGSGKTIDLITFPEKIYYQNVFEYLKGRESSINVSGSGVEYFVNYRSTRTTFGGMVPMSIFVDGVASDNFYAATIPFRDIALVQIYGNGFVGAEGNGPGGAIAIFTKKGEDITGIRAGNLNSLKLEGFSPVKEFFSPDYTESKPGMLADARTTLYWNPYLETSAKNKTIDIKFFNSDKAKKFRVILTGMAADGRLLYIEKIIE